MATTPTPKPTILKTPIPPVGGHATAAAGTAGAGAAGKKSKGMQLWIYIGAGVLLLIGLAGGGWFWKKHAHRGSKPATNAPTVSAPKAVKPVAPATTISMPMDPFLVNLADAGGHSYARISLTLRLVAPATAKTAEAKPEGADAGAGDDELKDMARDTIITVLSQQLSDDLMAPGGKDHLKELLRQAMIARDPRLKVVDIYFTEFLVQA